MKGILYVVGTGIRAVSQITRETEVAIKSADKVFYLIADPISEEWIKRQNWNAESLYPLYEPQRSRFQSYLAMVERVIAELDLGKTVVFALYGHPGIFAFPPHEAIVRARLKGHEAKMLPGISAEDSLFADLGVDPGAVGCISFEATDFLLRKRTVDPSCGLILWQIGLIGRTGFPVETNTKGLQLLQQKLAQCYEPSHDLVLYEASPYPMSDSRMERIALEDLSIARVTPVSTLYVPPGEVVFPDLALARELGIPEDYFFERKRAAPFMRANRPAIWADSEVSLS